MRLAARHMSCEYRKAYPRTRGYDDGQKQAKQLLVLSSIKTKYIHTCCDPFSYSVWFEEELFSLVYAEPSRRVESYIYSER